MIDWFHLGQIRPLVTTTPLMTTTPLLCRLVPVRINHKCGTKITTAHWRHRVRFGATATIWAAYELPPIGLSDWSSPKHMPQRSWRQHGNLSVSASSSAITAIQTDFSQILVIAASVHILKRTVRWSLRIVGHSGDRSRIDSIIGPPRLPPVTNRGGARTGPTGSAPGPKTWTARPAKTQEIIKSTEMMEKEKLDGVCIIKSRKGTLLKQMVYAQQTSVKNQPSISPRLGSNYDFGYILLLLSIVHDQLTNQPANYG